MKVAPEVSSSTCIIGRDPNNNETATAGLAPELSSNGNNAVTSLLTSESDRSTGLTPETRQQLGADLDLLSNIYEDEKNGFTVSQYQQIVKLVRSIRSEREKPLNLELGRLQSSVSILQTQNLLISKPGVTGRMSRRERKTVAINDQINQRMMRLAKERKRERGTTLRGFDIESDILDWSISVQDALISTLEILAKMLATVALLCAVSGISTYLFVFDLQGLSLADAAIEQFGEGNFTGFDLKSAEFDDIYAEERSKRIQIFGSLMVCFAWFLVNTNVATMLNIPLWTSYRYALPLGISAIAPGIYYGLGGKRTSSYMFIIFCIIAVSITVSLVADNYLHFGKTNLIDEAVKAAKERQAESRVETREEKRKKRTFLQRITKGAKAALPVLFTTAVGTFYILALFSLFDLHDSIQWKVFVSLIALGIKVTGNKGELILITKGRIAGFVGDTMLFGYEITTALMCRILQLSIPDQAAAQLFSLSSAIIEMGTRVFFYNLFLKAGMKSGKRMSKDEEKRYKSWAYRRVQDGSNDMVVEYLSSITAVIMLVWLGPIGGFKFAKPGDNISTNQILAVSFFQLAPEIILDFYCTFMEVFGGLSKLHTEYWTILGHADAPWQSTFLNALSLKVIFCVFITGLVVMTSAN